MVAGVVLGQLPRHVVAWRVILGSKFVHQNGRLVQLQEAWREVPLVAIAGIDAMVVVVRRVGRRQP